VAEPHDVLGVDADASADEIKTAYKVLNRVYQSDSWVDTPTSEGAEVERRLADLNAAYRAMLAFSVVDVVYGTEGWTNHERGRLTEALLDAEIPHEWSGAEVTVVRRYEKVVEQILVQQRTLE